MLPIRDMLDNLIWNEFYEFSDVFRRIFIKFSYPFAVISWTIGMLSLHIWICTQHGMAFLWRAIEIFVDNLPGTICIKIYRDEIAFDIYLCFLLLFLLVFWAFHSLLIIFQALMLVHTLSPEQIGIRANQASQTEAEQMFVLQMSDSFFSIFHVFQHQKHLLEFSFQINISLKRVQRVL